MCIIRPSPKRVSRTRIFARNDGFHQFLAYEMSLDADRSVAMTLPLPITLPTRKDSFRFVDVSEAPDFLLRLGDGFPERLAVEKPEYRTLDVPGFMGGSTQTLPVQKVGSFQASFVPSRRDFDRINPVFRLPDRFWESVNEYDDWGFAVFQLDLEHESADIEPMALCFRTRYADRLFFPTLHLHSTNVERAADFDHELFAQGLKLGPRPELSWEEAMIEFAKAVRRQDFGWHWEPPCNSEGWFDSMKSIRNREADVGKVPTCIEGLIDKDAYVFKKVLHGTQKNQDTWATIDSYGSRIRGI